MEAGRLSCIVLSAAGTHAPAYVGALMFLEEKHALKYVRSLHGTSAGSLVCAMAACGVTAPEMIRIMEAFASRTHSPTAKDILRVPSEWGALDIERTLAPLLDTFLEPEETFITLAKRTGVSLSVHAYNVSTSKLEDFGIYDTPDMSVRRAICASCCVPLVFKPVVIGNHMYVDGAISQRTPLHMVQRTMADAKNTLVLDVKTDATSAPGDVWQYMARLTNATGRHVGSFEGTFLTIALPESAITLMDLPAVPGAMEEVMRSGYDAMSKQWHASETQST